MVEIGKTKIIRWKDKRTGENRERVAAEQVRRVTRNEYGHAGKKRRLVVILEGEDLITIKPHGCRTQSYSGRVWDIYYHLVRGSANRVQLEKARERKKRQQRQRESAAIARADARLRREARAERLASV